MNAATRVALIVGALVALAALALWLRRRAARKRRHHKDHAPELAFLVTEHGFDKPVGHVFSRETHYQFKRGADAVDIFWTGGEMGVNVRMQGQTATLTQLSLEELAQVIREHPEVLRGDLTALIAADDAAGPAGAAD